MKTLILFSIFFTSFFASLTVASAQTSEELSRKAAQNGCYYQQVECIQEPCPPILICPSPKPSYSPHPSPMPAVRCENLIVASGNNSNIPATVVLRSSISGDENQVKKYRYYFGDGTQEETTNVEISHKYEVSGNFIARVDVMDANGRWINSPACETPVTVKASSLESHKSSCSDLYVTVNNSGVAPATVSFSVSGYDNKDGIKKYKLDFGNGVVKESDGRTFEQSYEIAGNYTVKAYVLDSENNWKGGEESCKKTFTITNANQPPLKGQPETGAPTVFLLTSLAGLGLGGVGFKRLYP